MRTDRRSFRRAVAASVGAHAALVVGLFLAGRSAGPPAPADPPGIDTRAPQPPTIQIRLAVETVVAPPTEARPADAPRSPERPEPSAELAPDPRPPLATALSAPRTLPPELLALLRKDPPQPVGAAVVEVPLTPARLHTPPAASPGTAVPGLAAPGPPAIPPIHGTLGPGQSVVYVLDASGSMGEWGKFDRARPALVATLRAQPPAARFQVVLYAGRAFAPLPAPVGGCVAATATNVARMADALAVAVPAGRSDHAAGVRAAAELRPDVVLVLTDAADLPAAKLLGAATAAAGRPVRVWVAKVTADRVETPIELR